ncbi:hypothetical protein BS47DRAFT_667700 [Hydnum rufescens UP504]|uniref:Uncharacterized protein n=1 Tax=Hydnum rufescens UP504 TaxID=1448309 RepID=A0A9P6DZZ6_9AGAM|nr:hypothetical protein BS47DRAFT_667700 [Hydnum rufescens UP504]
MKGKVYKMPTATSLSIYCKCTYTIRYPTEKLGDHIYIRGPIATQGSLPEGKRRTVRHRVCCGSPGVSGGGVGDRHKNSGVCGEGGGSGGHIPIPILPSEYLHIWRGLEWWLQGLSAAVSSCQEDVHVGQVMRERLPQFDT